MVIRDLNIENLKDEIEFELRYSRREIVLQFDLNPKTNATFNFDIVKKYIDEINKLYPNNNFKIKVNYVFNDEYILDTKDCKELEIVDNYLRENGYGELYISQKKDMFECGFRQTLSANRKLDDIAEKIKNATNNGEPLSTFEKFMIAYEYVTQYVYNRDFSTDYNDRHWIPVIEGDRIVCSGYASLLRALCDRIFSFDEVKVIEQNLNICDKENDNEILGGHANNLIFIKDEKYGIDGLFYVDSCWDSIEFVNQKDYKSQAFCCIPLSDILNHKEYSFTFDTSNFVVPLYFSENEYYQDLIEEVEEMDEYGFIDINLYSDNDSIEDYIEKCLFDPSYDKKTAEYLKNSIPDIVEYDINNNNNHEIKVKNAKAVIDFIFSKADSNPIPIEAFINSYKIIGKMKGLSKEEIKEYVKNRIIETAKKVNNDFDIEQCDSCFAQIDTKDLKRGVIKPK